MQNRGIAFIIAAVVLAASFCGCSRQPDESIDDGRINVVASIFPAYDFARAIMGENANLTMLVSPGSSIHSYDPSPSDMKKIADADVFIYIGGENDKWVERALLSSDISAKRLVKLIDYVDTVKEETEDHENGFDEHIWTSPKNAVLLVEAITDTLCEADPNNDDTYRENSNNYISEIQKIDEEIRQIVQTAKRNKIVVADRFPFLYLADEYGLSYAAAFGGCSDQSDASVATVAYLVKTVEDEKIPCVYYVEMSAGNIAKLVSEQTGAAPVLLHSCQNVSKAEFDAGETYVSLMRQNAESLERGLN